MPHLSDLKVFHSGVRDESAAQGEPRMIMTGVAPGLDLGCSGPCCISLEACVSLEWCDGPRGASLYKQRIRQGSGYGIRYKSRNNHLYDNAL